MYGLTASAAALLAGRPATAVALAAAGVALGWPFSILATVPLVLFGLFTGGFWRVFAAGAFASLGTLVREEFVLFLGGYALCLYISSLTTVSGGCLRRFFLVMPSAHASRLLPKSFEAARSVSFLFVRSACTSLSYRGFCRLLTVRANASLGILISTLLRLYSSFEKASLAAITCIDEINLREPFAASALAP
jgi:hypothetical protein